MKHRAAKRPESAKQKLTLFFSLILLLSSLLVTYHLFFLFHCAVTSSGTEAVDSQVLRRRLYCGLFYPLAVDGTVTGLQAVGQAFLKASDNEA